MRERREVTQPSSSDLPMIKQLSSGLCKIMLEALLLPLSHIKVSVVLVEICPADQTMEISLENEKCITDQTSQFWVEITLEMERALWPLEDARYPMYRAGARTARTPTVPKAMATLLLE